MSSITSRPGVVRRVRSLVLAVAAAAGMASAARGATEGYYRYPSVRGDKVVFTSEGDLWSAPLSGGQAMRLTSHPANETGPKISPDGRWIAFTADYEGQGNAYVIPIDGGEPRRLTFAPNTIVSGWSPDSSAVLFRTRPTGRDSEEFLYSIALAGGEPERLPLGTASVVSYSPDGKKAVFNRWLFNLAWRNYRGGTATQMWVADLGAGSFRRLAPVEGVNANPMWIGDRIYFAAYRGGTMNLCSVTPDGGDLRQHTNFTDYDVRMPETDGKTVVFAKGADLWAFDVAKGEARKIEVALSSDRLRALPRAEDAAKTIDGYALDKEGKRLAVSSRGQIWTTSVRPGSFAFPAASDPRARERGPVFSPDGRTLVGISDATGEQELTVFSAAGTPSARPLTHRNKGWIFEPVYSGDGKHVAYADLTMSLFVVNPASGEATTVDTSEAEEIREYAFSPDGKLLAYTRPAVNGMSEVWVYDVAAGRKHRVSGGFTADSSPAWDRGGKYLFFVSSRHFDPLLDEVDFDYAIHASQKLCCAVLRKDGKSPLLPEELLDDEGGEKKGTSTEVEVGPIHAQVDVDVKGGATRPSVNVKVTTRPASGPATSPAADELDGIESRIVELPVDPGNYTGLECVEGKLLYLVAPARGLLSEGDADLQLKAFDIGKRKSEDVISGVKGFCVSGDGKRIAVQKGNDILVGEASASIAQADDKVEVSRLPLVVDTRAEWADIFADAWRLQRDFYFAENMGGVDWNAAKYKYEKLLPRVGHRAELNDLIAQMQGELGTSHEYVSGGDLSYAPPSPISVGLLGAEVAVEKGSGLHRFERIYRPENWEGDVESPLSASYLDVREGDYLLAINGQVLAPTDAVGKRLENLAGAQVRLTVGRRADKSDAREIQVTTLREDFELKYRDWARRNREYVDKKSGGKVGYFHLPDMEGAGLSRFTAGFFPQFQKQGLVIDARDNHGGFVSQLIIQRLSRTLISYNRPRRGAMTAYPQKTALGYKCVLINQHAGSDGDIFPNAFQTMKLGPLIGVRTWGGVIGIRSDKPFVDGGMSTQPEYAWWSPTRGWALENHGVDPDIEVNYAPEDYLAGRDPQLDRGIEEMMGKIAERPIAVPDRPADPDHPGGK